MSPSLTSIPLKTGTIVMATGVVAIGMSRIGVMTIAAPLLVVAVATWLALLVAQLGGSASPPRASAPS
ncbi:MAG TPA: hypothetical protein VNF24_11395 [Candidatus Acidoferrales bacterium]|nr:hypothetical protein [Candidatus Acidoferrales bacterium]